MVITDVARNVTCCLACPTSNSHQSAYCPRCQAKNSRRARLVANAPGGNGFHHAVADAVCLGRTPLHIWLLGIRIDANVMQGIWQMTKQGHTITGAMVFFCVIGAPLILVSSIAYHGLVTDWE